ncbi:MAG: hypothetical protein JWQ71_3352 [Pedosphaera sp.]|nr:hypothetical protein [Pedosphaera sp.]
MADGERKAKTTDDGQLTKTAVSHHQPSLPTLDGVDIGWRVILYMTKPTPNGDITDYALFRFQSLKFEC